MPLSEAQAAAVEASCGRVRLTATYKPSEEDPRSVASTGWIRTYHLSVPRSRRVTAALRDSTLGLRPADRPLRVGICLSRWHVHFMMVASRSPRVSRSPRLGVLKPDPLRAAWLP